MIRLLYSLGFYLALPLIALRLAWRARRAPAYAQRVGERFGFFAAPPAQGAIWIHAVSVGETLAAVPLVRALREAYPALPIVVTTMTPTGSAQVRAQLGDSVFHVYAPYDFPDAVARFLDRIRPRVAIIMETELWPNLIAACERRSGPVLLLTARLSEKSARGYKRLSWLARPMVGMLGAVGAQAKADGERFLALGLPPAGLHITGNIKFDVVVDEGLRQRAQALRASWLAGGERCIWIAASTRQGEDEQILDAFEKVLERKPQMLLLLVPRHPERFAAVTALSQQRGLRTVRRSQGEPANDTQVLIGDTLGELLLLYGTAGIAFVGGSLVDTGGHNMLEPAAWGLPIVTGQSYFNFVAASELLLQAGALVRVPDASSLANEVLTLAGDADVRARRGAAARLVLQENQGALARTLALVQSFIDGD